VDTPDEKGEFRVVRSYRLIGNSGPGFTSVVRGALLREFSHLRAASWTGRAKHVAAFSRLLHRSLIVRNSFLLFTLYTKHFSQ